MSVKDKAKQSLDNVKVRIKTYQNQLDQVAYNAYDLGYSYEGELPFGSSLVAGVQYGKGIAAKKNYNKTQSKLSKLRVKVNGRI